MKLRFGKFSGLDTAETEIPITYLQWLESQMFITDELRKDLNEEIRRRSGDRPGAGKAVRRGK